MIHQHEKARQSPNTPCDWPYIALIELQQQYNTTMGSWGLQSCLFCLVCPVSILCQPRQTHRISGSAE